MFDARLLSVFREVATRGSFSDAATALSFTQPAISQQIARLERQLETRLLVRDARGVTLTPAGEVLLRHAETVLAQLRLAEAEVQALTGVERPRLRVGAFPSAAASIMPPALAELRAAHPEADVAMRVVEDVDALDALRRGDLDIAMVIDSELMPLELPAGIEAVHVLDDPLLIALPYSHRLAARSAISLADLRDDEWMICGVGGTCIDSNVILRACDTAGFEPRITFESEDYGAIMGMVASGMGVALIPSLALVRLARTSPFGRCATPARCAGCEPPSPWIARARWPTRCSRPCVRLGASARGPDGSGPSLPPDAQAASGSSSSTRWSTMAGRAAAGRTARAWICSRSTIAAVCSKGSAMTAPVSIDVAASSRPSTSATKSSPLGTRRESSAARRSSAFMSSAAAWRIVMGATSGRRWLMGRRSWRSSTRDRDRRRWKWSLNMTAFCAATGLRTSG